MDANIRLDSEHSLSQIIGKALNQNPELSSNQLAVSLNKKELVLTGNVANYYQKQLAQESIRSLAGELTIQNDIKVLLK